MVVLQDKYTFVILEIILTIFTLFAFLFDKYTKHKNSKGGIGIVVTRGKESWDYLKLAFIIGTTYTFLKIIDATESVKDFEVLFIVANTSMIFYLTFRNDCFKNKLLGFF